MKLIKRCSNELQLAVELAVLVMLLLVRSADSLAFRSVQMPSLVQRGANFWLSCQFELNDDHHHHHHQQDDDQDLDFRDTQSSQRDQLYSVKWYKNNEEFYRLISASSSSALANGNSTTSTTSTTSVSNNHYSLISNEQGQLMQQQYFPQPGLNVMMASSNATHVRLLNASLDTEGIFACEISTQNLASIRHEKEIKVYVLPNNNNNHHQRPIQVVGLRSRYSMGDLVELNCLSEPSRPAGALGWFANQRRIQTTGKWFELIETTTPTTATTTPTTTTTTTTNSKSNLPETGPILLFRSSLVLKFKLTSDLLLFWSSSSSMQSTLSAGNEARNQSWPTSAARQLARLTAATARRPLNAPDYNNNNNNNNIDQLEASLGQEQTSGRLLELLKLECKYKLTEVSDVTFNELLVVGASSPPINSTSTLAASTAAWGASRGRRHGRPRPKGRQQPLVAKTADNQILQAWQTSRPMQLLDWLRPRPATCSSSGGVQLDDPLLLVDSTSERSAEMDEEEQQLRRRRSRRHLQRRRGSSRREPSSAGRHQPLEAQIGSTLSVNCSTLAALLGGVGVEQPTDVSESVGGGPSTFYCGDWFARRKWLISGKYQQPMMMAADQQQQHQVDLNNGGDLLGGQPQQWRHRANNSSRQHYNRQQQPQQLVAYLSLPANGADSPPPPQLQAEAPTTRRAWTPNTNTLQAERDELLAPPLLEWFMNHQEAPRSSASYSPELPLVAVAAPKVKRPSSSSSGAVEGSSYARRQQAQLEPGPPEGGAEASPSSSSSSSSAPLPSIDYRQYFANFAGVRSIEQHLKLSLKLDKKHFATSDSLLRLRCSSTQAQVLLSDSVQVTLVGLPAGSATSLPVADQTSATGRGWSHPARQRPAHSQAARNYQRSHQLVGSGGGVTSRAPSTSAAKAPGHPNQASNGATTRPLVSLMIPVNLLLICLLVYLIVC